MFAIPFLIGDQESDCWSADTSLRGREERGFRLEQSFLKVLLGRLARFCLDDFKHLLFAVIISNYNNYIIMDGLY